VRERTKISIAMAVYNGERFLTEQLESLAHQKRPPDELVVSDNASSDRTVEIAREFGARAPFPVRVLINDTNLGVSRNFERAMRECSGEIIFPCDCDDVWYPEKVAIMESALEQESSAAFALCDSNFVDEKLRPIGCTAWEHFGFNPERIDRRRLVEGTLFSARIPCLGHALALRRRVLELVLPFPDTEQFRRGWFDYFMTWTTILCGGGGMVLVSRPLVAYRRHDRSISAGSADSTLLAIAARWQSVRRRGIPTLPSLIERLELAETAGLPPSELRAQVLWHWRARCFLPKGRIARLPQVTRELVTLRYHRFSSGFRTAAKDLLFAK